MKKGGNKAVSAPRSQKSRSSAGGKLRMKGMTIAAPTPRGGKVSMLDVQHRMYGGELVITGEMDSHMRAEIMGTIKNVTSGKIGRTAKKAEVRMEKDHIIVLTAESQPAVALGKKLHHAHKGGRLKIVWSDDASPVRVHWTTGE